MKTNSLLRQAAAPSLLLGALALVSLGDPGPGPQGGAQADLVLVPHMTTDVYAAVPTVGQVTVYYPGTDRVRVEGVSLSVEGVELADVELDELLDGHPDYGRLSALIESLPEELAHLHRRAAFAEFLRPGDADRPYDERLAEIRRLVDRIRARSAVAALPSFTQPVFPVFLDQIFAGDEAPGTRRQARITLRWRDASGQPREDSTGLMLTWRGPRPGVPGSFAQGNAGASVHAGDLHVHSCAGEALGACSPYGNCGAETLQTSGSFTYSQLASQYQALGMDWFTGTDHSYCINSQGEWDQLITDASAASGPGFLCLPHMELSSDEAGPQVGSDLGDALCLGTTSANHMGAHGITDRLEGGDDAIFGFCDSIFGFDALDGFPANVAAIRAQGGFPIVNHPDGSSFGWNSRAAAQGQEQDALHGVEIWNGGLQTGQGGNVGAWVNWLLDGRVLYAYSGSDTHDAAFDFGANHALVMSGTFDSSSVLEAVRAGRVFISNGPSLILEVELGGQSLVMGEQHTLPSPLPSTTATPRVHYDFGAGSGQITLFRGQAGDGAETVLCQSATLSGSGVFECSLVLPSTGPRLWVRAYSENGAGDRAAYTNPVFFEHGSGDVFTYCTPKTSDLGCVPRISTVGVPSASAGFGFAINAEEIVPGQNGLMIYGYNPRYTPFQDGTLCVAPPQVRTQIQNSGGALPACDGSFSFDFNQWIAAGTDASIGVGSTLFAQYWFRDPFSSFPTGLTDAVQFTVQP